MKKLYLTCDSPAWSYVSEIQDELLLFERILLPKYKELPFDFCIGFRCIPDAFDKWKSRRRYEKDEEVLYIDIIMFHSEFDPIKGDKNGQRKVMGKYLYSFFCETLERYKKKLPLLNEYKDELKADLEEWLIKNKWYGDTPNLSEYTIKQIIEMYVEIRAMSGKDVFERAPANEIAIPKLVELKKIVNVYLIDQPNDVEALRIMCFIQCYLMEYSDAYKNLEHAYVLNADYKDRAKLERIKKLMEQQ